MFKKFFLLILILAAAGAIYYYSQNTKWQKEEFTLWTIQLKPVAQSIIEDNIRTFEDRHPDIKVVWVDIPIAEAQKRTLASVLGGSPPDLINLNPDFSVVLAQRGALEYFDEKDTQNFVPDTLNMLKYDGRIFALPYYATSSVTLYNKEIFNKCGFNNPPQTYEELYKSASQLKKCSGIYPYAANLNENDSFAKILNKYEINNFYSDENLKKAEHIFKIFDDMYKKNLISKDTLTINHREMAEKYMSGNALFVVLGSNFLNMIKENAPSIYQKSDISTQLSAPKGKYDIALMNLIIPKRAKHKELAKEFANIMTDKNSQIELAKATNVIPVNKYALEDDYFSNCTSDLEAKARCISIKQLNNIQDKNFGTQNKKAINDTLNKSIEEVLLNSHSDNELKKYLNTAAREVDNLMKN